MGGNPNWKKGGPSPNPGGRPKAPVRLRERYFKDDGDDKIYQRMMNIITSETSADSDAVKAAHLLLDRIYGRVATVDVDGEEADRTFTVVIPRFKEPDGEDGEAGE